MAEFHLSVVAPDRSVVEESVQSVTLPGVAGYLGVLAGHEPLVVALKPGVLEYLGRGSNRHWVSIAGGFAEITGAKVTVLADAAEASEEIDLKRAEAALERANKVLRGETPGNSDEAAAEMERAIARIKSAKTK